MKLDLIHKMMFIDRFSSAHLNHFGIFYRELKRNPEEYLRFRRET